jgi:inhibitor of KinA
VTAFRLVSAGDSALVVEFEARIDPSVNARAIQLADALQAARLPGVRDVVPTFRSVAIYFDPLHTNGDTLFARVEAEAAKPSADPATDRPAVRVPVCYGGEFGPDLAAVAAYSRLNEAEVVAAHTGRTYRAFMVGFVPGFAYLGTVDERIAMPRRDTPRVRVPVGSVGIAGVQTGIYPMETPGGWQLVGRTPLKPFDPDRAEPFLVKAGDAVAFYAIDPEQFLAMERAAFAPEALRRASPKLAGMVGERRREGFLVAPKPPGGESGSRALPS